MNIFSLGINYTHSRDFSVNRPNGSDSWLILLFHTPAGRIHNQKTESINKDSVIIYPKGTPQYYFAVGETFVNDWIHFDIGRELHYLKDLNIPTDTVLELNDVFALNSVLSQINLEFFSTNKNKENSVSLLMKLFFSKLSEQITLPNPETNNRKYYDNLVKIRSNIYNTPAKFHNVQQLADILHITCSYFQNIYKAAFGVTCMTDIIQARIDYAKYLLISTDYSINRISLLCGYENDIHFMRQFKKKTGTTPSGYRRSSSTD